MNIYDEFYLNIYRNPYNYGELEDATLKVEAHKASCGDHINIYLKIEQGKIVKARFTGKGCVVSMVGASLLMKEIEGKLVDEIKTWKPEIMYEITHMDLSRNPSREQCLMLSFYTLQNAFKNLSSD